MYFTERLEEKQEKRPTGVSSPWKSMRRGSAVDRFLPKQKYHQATYWMSRVTSCESPPRRSALAAYAPTGPCGLKMLFRKRMVAELVVAKVDVAAVAVVARARGVP